MTVRISDTKQSPGYDLYDRGEHEWIAAQISALASGQMTRLDPKNLIEFLSEHPNTHTQTLTLKYWHSNTGTQTLARRGARVHLGGDGTARAKPADPRRRRP
jgi:hypothetical protein